MLREPDPVLLDALASLESEFTTGVSEFALLTLLKAPPWHLFTQVDLSDSLTLFRCHFTLFNALYTLSDHWRRKRQQCLDIHTLNIRLVAAPQHQDGMVSDDGLKRYYLDWSNFTSTESEDVDALLASFWQRFDGEGADVEALRAARNALGFSAEQPLTAEVLKKRYRQRMSVCHPDKGGDHQQAQQIISAYRLLRAHTSHNP